jgi:hypothetical protein
MTVVDLQPEPSPEPAQGAEVPGLRTRLAIIGGVLFGCLGGAGAETYEPLQRAGLSETWSTRPPNIVLAVLLFSYLLLTRRLIRSRTPRT